MSEAEPKFESKARVLASLAGRLTTAEVLPQVSFSVDAWTRDREEVLGDIATQGWSSMAVRSSSGLEDTLTSSQAGAFLSLLGVGPDGLDQAVRRVAASMADGDPAVDEVLVQPMVADVVCAGVAFGVAPSSQAPYVVINYDDSSGETDSVTSGTSNSVKTFYAHHTATDLPEPLDRVVALVKELQLVYDRAALDVEFAIDVRGAVHLLQVRPLVVGSVTVDVDAHRRNVQLIHDRLAQEMRPLPFLHGERTVYGVMPDWNPAEIIGVRPKPLALSLYRELVTDMIWSYQRNNYGYRNLRSFPLMVHFHGLPYIDARVSFNSFVPKDIESPLADKLVNHYIDRLVGEPDLHDKVEFEIVYSCYMLDLRERLKSLEEVGFTATECDQLATSLRGLTNRIVNNRTGLWRTDRDKLDVLQRRRDTIFSSDMNPVGRIYWLLEDCRRYGTLPFAGLARAGFIAVQLLRSLVSVGVLSDTDYAAFLNSVNTVSGQMARDLSQLDRTTFLSKYGHLRPGTYDILSPRYDETPDLYFNWTDVASRPPEPRHGSERFALSLTQMRDISGLLAEHGLDHDVVGLFDFLQAGIELREYGKFVFTQNLSDAISLFRDFGRGLGFSPEDLAFASIGVVKELHTGSVDPVELIGSSIEEGRARYARTCEILLPPLITRPGEAFAFHMPQSQPNFMTLRDVTAPVVSHEDRDRLRGAIVAIPSADPGFDWIFSHGIAGFVTAYGGANSHMAIRAGELDLPAVVGAGEQNYAAWASASVLRIDCANRRVEVLR